MSSGLFVVNKPTDWTSHDVCAKLRGILQERRLGHAGTLDPMATGVLVVFAGRATRAVPYLPGNKTYRAGFKLGFETDTQDITGNVVAKYDKQISKQDVLDILHEFTGKIEQIPPMVSAIQINGQRLYKLARQGIEIERQPRKIEIFSIDWVDESVNHSEYFIDVSCSAGTYIRTLIHDIGKRLGSGGVLTSLCRTKSAQFSIEQAFDMSQISWDKAMPVDSLFENYPKITASTKQESRLRNGGSFTFPSQLSGFVRVYNQNGEFLLLGNIENETLLIEKSFFEI